MRAQSHTSDFVTKPAGARWPTGIEPSHQQLRSIVNAWRTQQRLGEMSWRAQVNARPTVSKTPASVADNEALLA